MRHSVAFSDNGTCENPSQASVSVSGEAEGGHDDILLYSTFRVSSELSALKHRASAYALCHGTVGRS